MSEYDELLQDAKRARGVDRPVSIRPDEFAIVLAGQYGQQTCRVEVLHKSTNPEKMRAEVLTLAAGFRAWMKAENISVDKLGVLHDEGKRIMTP